MIEDVTDLREAEQALQNAYRELEQRVETRTAELKTKARELERSNYELEQFAYVASHDLQEPLRSVSVFAQLLARRYSPQLDEDGRDFLRFILEGTERMRRLITELLRYSRVGAEPRVFGPTDLEDVLGQALANLAATIQEREAKVSHDPLPEVWGDQAELVQLLQNLVGNAIKFNDSEAPRVHLSAEREEDHWRIAVADNGIGIAETDLERIFTIFQRVHSMDGYEGTGVGLAVCKKIVERHHGRIWVESVPGQGATFYFTLRPHDFIA